MTMGSGIKSSEKISGASQALMNETLNVSFGLVFFNEAQRIHSFIDNLEKAIDGLANLDFELVCIDNNSTDDSALSLQREIEARGWNYQFVRSTQNNMGNARDQVLRLARSQLVYFIDFDVSVAPDSLLHLIQRAQKEMDQNQVCSWAGPVEISDVGEFQKDLRLLQKTWWGHMGSLQMKSSFSGHFINHSPTGHLLVKKEVYLSAGSFDGRLDRTGEDLEIHQRLADLGFRISWVPEAKALHDVAKSPKIWLAKCYKYGLAQTQIAKLRPRNWLRLRCVPIYFAIFVAILIAVHPAIALGLIGAYCLLIASSAFSLSRERWKQVFALLIATHIFYFLGEFAGIFRPLAKEEISTINM